MELSGTFNNSGGVSKVFKPMRRRPVGKYLNHKAEELVIWRLSSICWG